MGSIRLGKGVKNRFPFSGGDADTGVLYGEPQAAFAGRPNFQRR